MIMFEIKWMIVACIYGFVEAYIYDNGFRGGKYKIKAGAFKVNAYQISIVAITLILLWPNVITFFLIAPIQDTIFYTFSKSKTISANSWVAFNLGGITIFKRFVPTSYYISLAIYTALVIYGMGGQSV